MIWLYDKQINMWNILPRILNYQHKVRRCFAYLYCFQFDKQCIKNSIVYIKTIYHCIKSHCSVFLAMFLYAKPKYMYIGGSISYRSYVYAPRWFSERMLDYHAGGPGSIPGRCNSFVLLCQHRFDTLKGYASAEVIVIDGAWYKHIGGSVVECSPATRVWFPADAILLNFFVAIVFFTQKRMA